MFLYLQNLFPNEDIAQNYELSNIKYNNTETPIILEYFIPVFGLALEYHSKKILKFLKLIYSLAIQHYRDNEAQRKAKERKEKCEANGIILVAIPHWWDNTISSLEATLFQYKKDLFGFQPNGQAISNKEVKTDGKIDSKSIYLSY